MTYDLKDAGNRLSELFARAVTEGPQRIASENEAVVVVSERDWATRGGAALADDRTEEKRSANFAEHLLAMPKGSPLASPPRRVDMRDVDLSK